MKPRRPSLDAGSIIVMTVTGILFVLALVVKGFSHDLLLEAAVFLVSVKLIIMTYKNRVDVRHMQQNLDDLAAMLRRIHAPTEVEDPVRRGDER
jgi:hypothetical protein